MRIIFGFLGMILGYVVGVVGAGLYEGSFDLVAIVIGLPFGAVGMLVGSTIGGYLVQSYQSRERKAVRAYEREVARMESTLIPEAEFAYDQTGDVSKAGTAALVKPGMAVPPRKPIDERIKQFVSDESEEDADYDESFFG